MKFKFISLIALTTLLLGTQFPTSMWNANSSVVEVLIALNDSIPNHYREYTPTDVKRGEEIVKLGRTLAPNGKRSSFVSKYYMCTSCHNLEREDPDLRISDPEARLSYVKEKGIPFLQGSTFKGIVNRESWYNDDYVKKYGDTLIQKAHRDLKQSIQLCAIQCSQGRPMEDWELEAVLAYFWSLEFTLNDLGLNDDEMKKLNASFPNQTQNPDLVDWIKSFYLQKSPAHFFDAPTSKKEGYEGLEGNMAKGKDLYDLSCMYCHKSGGVSHYLLDQSKLSFNHLDKMIEKDSHFSLYQIIAYGTYAIPGHRPYMPHYPLERMSKQQVEDLRAYIEFKANQ